MSLHRSITPIPRRSKGQRMNITKAHEGQQKELTKRLISEALGVSDD